MKLSIVTTPVKKEKRKFRSLFQKYSLELVPAGLSQRYDKVSTVFYYCAVEVYLHAFSATALDADVPLTTNSDGYFLAERTTGTH